MTIDVLPGNETDPWRTLPYAIERLRSLRSPSPATPAMLHLSGPRHQLGEMLQLGSRDNSLTIRNYRVREDDLLCVSVSDPVLQDEKVVVSGGVALEPEWQRRGDILTAVWVGSCGEPYLGDYRSQITFNPDF